MRLPAALIELPTLCPTVSLFLLVTRKRMPTSSKKLQEVHQNPNWTSRTLLPISSSSFTSSTNGSLSNSISFPNFGKDSAASDASAIELCIDQLVNDLLELIQIGARVKRQLIRQWLGEKEGDRIFCIPKRITSSSTEVKDDMIKIDGNPIKIDDVIGHITQMDRSDDCNHFPSLFIFVTLEWSFFALCLPIRCNCC